MVKNTLWKLYSDKRVIFDSLTAWKM
jgi:hypothetical protein